MCILQRLNNNQKPVLKPLRQTDYSLDMTKFAYTVVSKNASNAKGKFFTSDVREATYCKDSTEDLMDLHKTIIPRKVHSM